MKSNIHLFSFIIFLFLCSCDDDKKTDNQIIIAGKMKSSEGEISVQRFAQLATSKIDEEGNFHLIISSNEAGLYTLEVEQKLSVLLFLAPGDSLYMEYDTENEEAGFAFMGDHVNENQYLRNRKKLENELGVNQPMELMKHEYPIYASKRDSIFDNLSQFLESKKNDLILTDIFTKKEEAYLQYKEYGLDGMYPSYHGYLTQKSEEEIEYPKEDWKVRQKELPLDKVEYLDIQEYEMVLLNQLESLTMKRIEKDSIEVDETTFFSTFMDISDSLFQNQRMKDHFGHYVAYQLLDYKGPVHSEVQTNKFLAQNKTEIYAKSIAQAQSKWESISPGKEVPDMKFTDINSEVVKLSDLKGQLVYIDIWATWCGPCIAEHPHWDQLKEDYKDQPIHFLTVSIDDDKSAWEKMIKNKKMDGLQWFAENGWASELAQHFKVNGIPRFLLLDAEGKVLDPSADRPSGKIKEFLDQHLKKV